MSTTRPTPSPTFRAWLALFFGVVAISWSTVWVKLAGVPGVSSAFWRCAFPALVTAPFLAGAWRRMDDTNTRRTALAGGALFGLHLCLWNFAIPLTDATRGTLYPNIAVIWFTLAAAKLHGEKPAGRVYAGLFIALAGLVVLAAPKLHGGLPTRGDFLCFLCSFTYAGYLTITKSARQKTSARDFMIVAAPAGVLTAGIVAFATGAPLSGYEPKSWAALAGLGLLSHLGGWLLIGHALGRLPAGPAGALMLIQAPLAAVWAILALGEYPDAALLAGGALTLLGVRFATRTK